MGSGAQRAGGAEMGAAGARVVESQGKGPGLGLGTRRGAEWRSGQDAEDRAGVSEHRAQRRAGREPGPGRERPHAVSPSTSVSGGGTPCFLRGISVLKIETQIRLTVRRRVCCVFL